MNQKRKSYSEKFKRKAVKSVQEQSKSLPQIAAELGINPDTLRQWVSKYRELEHEPINHGETLRQQSQVIHDQQREIEDLKEENAILKKAMHFFGKERN